MDFSFERNHEYSYNLLSRSVSDLSFSARYEIQNYKQFSTLISEWQNFVQNERVTSIENISQSRNNRFGAGDARIYPSIIGTLAPCETTRLKIRISYEKWLNVGIATMVSVDHSSRKKFIESREICNLYKRRYKLLAPLVPEGNKKRQLSQNYASRTTHIYNVP